MVVGIKIVVLLYIRKRITLKGTLKQLGREAQESNIGTPDINARRTTARNNKQAKTGALERSERGSHPGLFNCLRRSRVV
jgi:hypothetical protein